MKRYDEIAKNVFKRREEYLAKQKKKKRVVVPAVVSALCGCAILLTAVGLWESDVFRSNIPVVESSAPEQSDDSSVVESERNSTTATTPSQAESSSAESTTSHTSRYNDSTTQDEPEPDNTTPSDSPHTTSSTSKAVVPPLDGGGYFIDSIDKMNFYSAKRIINDNSMLPFGLISQSKSAPKATPLNVQYAEYPIDRNRVFTVSMVTYFLIELHDEEGFLAQKLGGIGTVEVVITENNIDDLGLMITFKREDRYYSCLINGESYEQGTEKMSRKFSSHKYINGFNIVKNKEQDNYQFVVHYDGLKVVGFECAPFGSVSSKYHTDSVTMVEDFCVVLYTKRNFTIDQLEMYFKNKSEEL